MSHIRSTHDQGRVLEAGPETSKQGALPSPEQISANFLHPLPPCVQQNEPVTAEHLGLIASGLQEAAHGREVLREEVL